MNEVHAAWDDYDFFVQKTDVYLFLCCESHYKSRLIIQSILVL